MTITLGSDVSKLIIVLSKTIMAAVVEPVGLKANWSEVGGDDKAG